MSAIRLTRVLRTELINQMKQNYPKGQHLQINVFPVSKHDKPFNNCCHGEEYHIHTTVGGYSAAASKYVGIGLLGLAGSLFVSMIFMSGPVRNRTT